MTQAVSGAKRLVEILEQDPDIRDAPDAGNFRFEGAPGEMVGLVGRSGAVNARANALQQSTVCQPGLSSDRFPR